MSTPLAGTAALVTGASSGIGAATASALAAQGASVALVARRKDRLDDLVEQIRADGGSAVAVAADITDRDQAASAVEQAVQAFGRVDTLVNNAGVMLLGPIEDAPVEEWDRMLAINVQGLLYTTHAALPHLLAAVESGDRRTADVVNVSSVAGRSARVGMGVYNLTKHGVGAFSESLRQEVAGRHVRVSLVEPGPVATELFGHIRPEVLQGAEGTFGTTNLLTASDVAETISFVVTRRAGAVVNEVLLRPDAAL
jgi:NADP-dependent 3-hydroxy acid dehydrogenase YdfG